MKTETITIPQTDEVDFQVSQVAPIAGAHFVHDSYTAFIPTLLPEIIDKLSLSLTTAGSLTALMQLPAIMNPFIGYLADKVSLRYFVILAPAATATLVSALGWAPNYFILALIFLAIGVSIATFHSPAPAMIARVSGKRVGLGMSIFMAGGELARTAGPPIAAWAITTWTLNGIYRTMFFGWAISFILYLRLRNVSGRTEKPGSVRDLLPILPGLFIPILLFYMFRNPLNVNLTTFFITFLTSEGVSLTNASILLAVLEFAGFCGALLSGPLSDRLGRKPILIGATTLTSILTLVYLNVDGWAALLVLALLGFSALSTTPVMLAIVQDQMPNNRAVGNGIFMVIAFLLQALSMVVIGALGDSIGLRATFTWTAVLSLLSIPAILKMPTSLFVRNK